MAGKILIVDDDRDITQIIQLLLEGEGYAVLTAEDGREAIAEAAAGRWSGWTALWSWSFWIS